jgi:hypothetical protein
MLKKKEYHQSNSISMIETTCKAEMSIAAENLPLPRRVQN